MGIRQRVNAKAPEQIVNRFGDLSRIVPDKTVNFVHNCGGQ